MDHVNIEQSLGQRNWEVGNSLEDMHKLDNNCHNKEKYKRAGTNFNKEENKSYWVTRTSE